MVRIPYVSRSRVIRRASRYRASGFVKTRNRRTYGRSRIMRRRSFPKKRVLNVTSQKKRDSMLTYLIDNTGATIKGSFEITGTEAVPQVYAWSPTMRGLTSDVKNALSYNSRTSTMTFAVGLSERMSLSTNDSTPWIWRRICFTAYGTKTWDVDGDEFLPIVGLGAIAGYQRAFQSLGGATNPPTQAAIKAQLYALIFQGTEGSDYSEINLAKTNNRGIKIMYDKSIRIESRSDNGVYRTYKQWFPMRKNLKYADEENGGQVDGNLVSEVDPRSMGDYYVIDFFTCADQDDAHVLTVNADATYYWHER